MEIIVPQLEMLPDGTLDIWPSLGPQIIEFLEDRFVYGPGPLKGEPYKVRDDFRYLLMRAYEHFPDGYHLKFGDIDMDMSGRRHFTEVNVSLPKGAAKTEFMALIALVELHPDAPIPFQRLRSESTRRTRAWPIRRVAVHSHVGADKGHVGRPGLRCGERNRQPH